MLFLEKFMVSPDNYEIFKFSGTFLRNDERGLRTMLQYYPDYFTVISEDARKGMIFFGKSSASYKAGNIKIDLKKAIIAGMEYVASVNKPESIFNYVQMVILSVLFVVKSARQEIGKLEALVVYFLHKRSAYEVGIEEEEFVCAMQE